MVYDELKRCYWDIKDIYGGRLMLDLTTDRLVDKIRIFLINWDERDGRLIPVDQGRLIREAEPLVEPAFALRDKLRNIYAVRSALAITERKVDG